MINQLKLKGSIRKFKLHGIDIIGNPEKKHIIGLNSDGNIIVDAIINGEVLENYQGLEELIQKNMNLINTMAANGYFDNNLKEDIKLNSAYFHVTNRCNLNCIGCYSLSEDRDNAKDLPHKTIVAMLRKLKNAGVESLIISGGEPLIRNDIESICQSARQIGISELKLISNGTMPFARYEKIVPYIDEIAISVDGYNEYTHFIRDKGIMPKVLDTLKRCRDLIPTHFIVTLHKKNIDKTIEYSKLSRNLGIPFNYSILTVDSNNKDFIDFILKKEDFEELIEGIENVNIQEDSCSLGCKLSCGAGKDMLSIASDGTVYPCHMLHREELRLGNLIYEDIEELLISKSNPLFNTTVENIDGCKECDYKYLCGGGCRARAYLETRSFQSVDSTCILSKRAIDLFFNTIT